MTKRDKVFDLINVERTYQDSKWGGRDHDASHSEWEWARMMRDRLSLCETMPSVEVLVQIRKVAAMAVACMEVHETPSRTMPTK